MRTETLMRSYLREPTAAPDSGWQRLVWHAADLIRMATQMRSTCKARRERKSKFVQEELFKMVQARKTCGDCALFYDNGHCHKDPNNPVVQRTGGCVCDKFQDR